MYFIQSCARVRLVLKGAWAGVASEYKQRTGVSRLVSYEIAAALQPSIASFSSSLSSLSVHAFLYLFIFKRTFFPTAPVVFTSLVVLPFSCAAVLLWETITEQLLPLPNWFLFPLSILLPLLCHSPAVRSPLHSFQFGELQHFPYILSFFFFFLSFLGGNFIHGCLF